MKGSIEVRDLHAPALEGNPLGDPAIRRTPVYLPPGYAQGSRRFPVVYFLQGLTGGGMSWLSFPGFSLTVPERLDRQVEAGAIPPFIGVFVDGWTAVGGSQWLNSAAIGRYQDYVAHDVVGFADREYRTLPVREARAVVGHSSGGYGALALGRDHPELFAHLGSQSGDAGFEYCYLGDLPKAAGAVLKAGGVKEWFEDFWRRCQQTKARGDDHAVLNALAMAAAYSPRLGEPMNIELPFELPTGRVREQVWARWLRQDPVRFIPAHPESFRQLSTVFVDCGTKDEFNLRWGARMVAEELRRIGVEVIHEEFEDGHMGISYRYARSLEVIGPRLGTG